VTAPGGNVYPGGDLTPAQVAALADAVMGTPAIVDGTSGDIHADMTDADPGLSPAQVKAIADRILGEF